MAYYARMSHKYDAANHNAHAATQANPSGATLSREQNGSRAGKALSCAVVGARGYSGLELVSSLLCHPLARVTEAYASKAFSLVHEIEHPEAAQIHVAGEDQVLASQAEVVFLATPPEVSLKLVPELVKLGKKVIDLSGAFRLQHHDVSDWYPFSVDRELLNQAHYGLVPFSGPMGSHSRHRFVSNPGCYATAIQMALIPLLKKGLIETDMVVVDAKSGTSGAGRKAQEGLLFTEVAEDIRPYRIGKHQHQPEILEGLKTYAGQDVSMFFSTHLLPVRHGILASIYAKAKTDSLALVEEAFQEAFQNYPLAKWGRLEERPQLANLTKVVGTPETRISYELRDGKLFIFSCIDNRLKGAASQAIENMNSWMDWPVATGLLAEQMIASSSPVTANHSAHGLKE